MQKKIAIFTPGLSNRTVTIRYAARKWEQQYSVTPVYCNDFSWQKATLQDLDTILNTYEALIDKYSSEARVHMIGVSAGGPLTVLMFQRLIHSKRDKIGSMVNMCGRIRILGEPTLARAAKNSPLFNHCVRTCDEDGFYDDFRYADFQKMYSIGGYTDSIVPIESTHFTQDRTHNHSVSHFLDLVPAVNHTLNIIRGLEQLPLIGVFNEVT